MSSGIRPTARAWAEVDLGAIRGNVAALRAAVGPAVGIMAVVKANAYGHGAIPVAAAALEAGADWLGVAAVAEGVEFRDAGVEAPIALLCAPAPGEADAIVHYRITPMVGDGATLDALAAAAMMEIAAGRPAEIHLDIDTGMGRSGVSPEAAVALWQRARERGLSVTGLATHFADADGAEPDFSLGQGSAFERAWDALRREGATFKQVHLSSSAAILRFPNWWAGLVRPGLLLYGIRPAVSGPEGGAAGELCEGSVENQEAERRQRIASTLNSAVRPALVLKARVATVRELPKGTTIGYGATWTMPKAGRVATVLIGYGDGYPRRLSNSGCMLLNGRRAPIRGRICMDQTVVDVTDIPGVAPGDEAVCVGAQGDERITVEEITMRVQTTEHELTTCLTPRIPRVYVP